MHEVQPRVFHIAETQLNLDAMHAMLEHLNGMTEQMERVIHGNGSEALTEIAGRICYRSYGVGVNPNVTKVRTDSGEYMKNTLAKGDGSIFEHASLTFGFCDVSRIFTHELVRHRVGIAISQESMRFVRITDIGMWLPDELTEDQRSIMDESACETEAFYKRLEASFKWDEMTMPQKKAATSALRRIIPDGIATNIIWTTNHRNLRHVLEQRTDPQAEIEIRQVFDAVGHIVTEKYPLIYQDFVREDQGDEPGWWKATLRRKV
jgi:thymidylate synthase (FAD)